MCFVVSITNKDQIIAQIKFRISLKFKLIIKLKLKFVATKKTPIIEIKTVNS